MDQTLLIIDDNPDDHQFYQRALKGTDYTIKKALSAEEGIELALRLNPALIILDYLLPDMNGLGFVEKLRNSHGDSIPILMLTGEGSEPIAVEALQLGVQDYVVKDQAGSFLKLLPSRIEQVLKVHSDQVGSRKLKQLHDTVLHSVADGVIGFDRQGVIVFANHAAKQMLGGTQQGLVNLQIADFFIVQGEPITWEQQPLAQLAPETATYACDACKLRALSGQSFPIHYTASRTSVQNGDFSGWVMVFQDSSQRKKAEEELRIAATTFEASEPIIITDARANILRVNQAYCDVTGYTAEEVIGKNPRIARSDQHDQQFFKDLWKKLLETGEWSGEIWDKRKNGEVFPKRISITAVKNKKGVTTQYVAIFSDITQDKKYEEEIHSLAYYDALTKLPNRRLFFDRFESALATSARQKAHGAILFVDLDHFKKLNDTLGHEYGDLLLIEVGARIQACLRQVDTVARFGGDEFVILLNGVSADYEEAANQVRKVAEKIRTSLTKTYRLKEHKHHCSPSIGAKVFLGAGETMENLLKDADHAMYQVKKRGRNGVIVHPRGVLSQ